MCVTELLHGRLGKMAGGGPGTNVCEIFMLCMIYWKWFLYMSRSARESYVSEGVVVVSQEAWAPYPTVHAAMLIVWASTRAWPWGRRGWLQPMPSLPLWSRSRPPVHHMSLAGGLHAGSVYNYWLVDWLVLNVSLFTVCGCEPFADGIVFSFISLIEDFVSNVLTASSFKYNVWL